MTNCILPLKLCTLEKLPTRGFWHTHLLHDGDVRGTVLWLSLEYFHCPLDHHDKFGPTLNIESVRIREQEFYRIHKLDKMDLHQLEVSQFIVHESAA